MVLNLYLHILFIFLVILLLRCSEATSSCLSFLPPPPPPPLEVLPFHPPSPFIRYSPPHLLSLSIPLLSTGICLGISRWKLRSISGAPYQHTIIMGNHAEHCWIQLGLPLWWHYWLQGPASAGAPHLHSYLHPSLLPTPSKSHTYTQIWIEKWLNFLFSLNQEVHKIRNLFLFFSFPGWNLAPTSNWTNPVSLSQNLWAFAHLKGFSLVTCSEFTAEDSHMAELERMWHNAEAVIWNFTNLGVWNLLH